MSGGHPFSADRNGMEMAEYMTLYLRDQENQEIGMERGLKIGRAEGEAIGEARGLEQGIEQSLQQGLIVLINSLKEFIPAEEALYQAIIKNDTYKDITRETVQKYLK